MAGRSTPGTSSHGPHKRRLSGRRLLYYLLAILCTMLFTTVYFTFFKRPPADELMRMNSRRLLPGSAERRLETSSQTGRNRSGSVNDPDVLEMLGGGEGGGADTGEESETGQVYWNKFVEKNNYVAVGEVYDRDCDAAGRLQIGVAVMLVDDEGIKTRTFLNFTLGEVLDTGSEFYMDVKYNGNDLFDNHWDLCTIEESLEPEERMIFCPVPTGKKSQVKDRIIPGYLPKGRYYTRSWVVNQNGRTMMCGISEFVL